MDPNRKEFVAMESDGIHGTQGTPQNLGCLALGTHMAKPNVPKNHIGTEIQYIIQPLPSVLPQYAAVMMDDPMIMAKKMMSNRR